MKRILKLKYIALIMVFLASAACEDLDTINQNNPDTQRVLASGTDLISVLNGGYIAWWQAIHDVHPLMALSITSDQFGVSWGNFAGRRMGEEPRDAYNNRASESQDYRKMVEDPWFGALSAVSTANDILIALDGGTTIDNGGDRDQSIRAAAYLLRGISNGYLAMLFDVGFRVLETDDISVQFDFVPYTTMVQAAVEDLDLGIATAQSAGGTFSHAFFNGVTLDQDQFIKLSNSYAARFLSSWPRTEAEAAGIDWGAVASRASQGIDFDFAPMADGSFWFSGQRYQYRDTGNGGFWARVDQRLVSAMDPSQPTRYPEIIAKGEAPLTDSVAVSDDARLLTDFTYVAAVDFPTDRGEWHFSHYKLNRNISDPTFVGDATAAGPMPVFIKADNDMLHAEALLNTGDLTGAIDIINSGTRVTRGGLDPIDAGATFEEIDEAIMYEKAIELMGTAPFNMWLERRRRGPRLAFDQVDALGGLQLGTPAQLPVPSRELDIREEASYNFGGVNTDPEGINRF